MSFAIAYPGAAAEPLSSHGGAWLTGRPTSILCHFTVGCGDPHDTLASRNLSVHFGVMRDGKVLQYVDCALVAYHAYSMSEHAIGIEHAAWPGTCDLTVVQLQASAKLNAWLCARFDIPAVRAPGANLTKRGIGSHADGLEPGHNTWDPNGHYDQIWKADIAWLTGTQRTLTDRSPWTAAQYIEAVKTAMGGGDDLPYTEVQLKGIIQEAFSGLITQTGEFPNAVHFADGQFLRWSGGARPTGTTPAIIAKQAGWDQADGKTPPAVH